MCYTIKLVLTLMRFPSGVCLKIVEMVGGCID